MKTLFPGHYRPTDLELKDLWKKATFILDTNILLNLYRYSDEVKVDWLAVLKKINNRLWIPYHSVLEYQRNRLGVIAEQNALFDEVRSMVSGVKSELEGRLKSRLQKRHTIDAAPLINKIDTACQSFIDELEKLKKKQPQVHEEDSVRKALEELLADKIGPAPANQKYLDDIFAEGENRFRAGVPPGYLDQVKGKAEDLSTFSSGGLYYKRKFGDLIIWKQILEFASGSKTAGVILITDDRKEDWWWKVDSQGDKVIGPRPELVEEMQMAAGVPFYMYNSERFMEFAQANLAVKVKPESIDQIRDVAAASNTSIQISEVLPYSDLRVIKAVFDWYQRNYPGVYRVEAAPVMDMVFSSSDNIRTGFDVVQVDAPIDSGHLVSALSHSVRHEGIKPAFLAIIIPAPKSTVLNIVLREINATLNQYVPYDFIVVGRIMHSAFVPLHRFDIDEVR